MGMYRHCSRLHSPVHAKPLYDAFLELIFGWPRLMGKTPGFCVEMQLLNVLCWTLKSCWNKIHGNAACLSVGHLLLVRRLRKQYTVDRISVTFPNFAADSGVRSMSTSLSHTFIPATPLTSPNHASLAIARSGKLNAPSMIVYPILLSEPSPSPRSFISKWWLPLLIPQSRYLTSTYGSSYLSARTENGQTTKSYTSARRRNATTHSEWSAMQL